MRLFKYASPSQWLLSLLLILTPLCLATDEISSQSLVSCQQHSGLTASLFNVKFLPAKRELIFNIEGTSTIAGLVLIQVIVTAYGYQALNVTKDPCDLHLAGLCPMHPGQLTLPATIHNISHSVIDDIPGIAYTIPDLDGVVQIRILKANTGDQVACVQARLSNGKTVYQKAVGWATAVIVGASLLASAIVSGLGFSNAAAHVASNTMSLFQFFQMQALFGMCAVRLPPIVSSWTQNFQWTMGIIHVGFIQDIAYWYQQATGGTPSTVLAGITQTSVNVVKRALGKRGYDLLDDLTSRARASEWPAWAIENTRRALVKRAPDVKKALAAGKVITVKGIDRVGFRADIELTNIFMTGYIFFIIFVLFVVIGVVAFRWILEALAKSGKIKGDKFQDFRNGWTTVLRGILFRLILIGFPQMVVLCFWELEVQDSAGEIVLAVITILTVLVLLGWACSKVFRLARRSISMHKNPAYILYSDPVCLHKWGFLYVQYKASAYWFVAPALAFLLLVGLFVGLGQSDGTVQAVALLVLTTAYLIGVSILRPYMDKKTNAFNISIAAVNFVSAIFLIFFTGVLGTPGLVVGVMGVIWFILNAAFALVLLILVMVATGFAIFSKNPDIRYQPMRDDRGSFIKSQSQLTTELDALGAAARGESKTQYRPRDIDEEGSLSGGSWDEARKMNRNSGIRYSRNSQNTMEGGGSLYAPVSNSNSRSNLSPQGTGRASPWQRGAGYDH